MQIIVIPHRLAKARTITVSTRHVFACMGSGLLLVASLTVGLYWLTIRYAAEVKIPVVRQMVLEAQKTEAARSREFVRQNLNAMAIKLGEMQAQLARLDALGDRLSKYAGIKPKEFRMAQAPGMGGAAPTMMPPQDLSLAQFREQLAKTSQQVEGRTDLLRLLEAQMLEQAVKRKLLPTMMPVKSRYAASGFGPRIDPFTGQWAMHEGIDFHADKGESVKAAAAGLVVFAGYHPQYGYMVEIDHGNDLVTRYGHCSKLFVRDGDVVQRGQKIAEVGSTGRSTGPHLHFEVRYKGVPQNPLRFLYANSSGAPRARGTAQGGPLAGLLKK